MLARISIFGVLWVLLVGIVAVATFVHDTLRAEQSLGEWSAKEDFELIESTRCFFETGPFMPFSRGVVYRVKVRNPEGKIRSGWIRCGGWFFGVSSDHIKVVWD